MACAFVLGALVYSILHLRRRVREARATAKMLRTALEGEERQRAFLEAQLVWAQRWRGEWVRALLAQRWARNAACFQPNDPQRPIFSAAAVALLLAPDIESVCAAVEAYVLPQPAPNQVHRPTAESQASEHWRQVVREGRDVAAGRVYTDVPDGQPQPSLDERLWRLLSGHSPVSLDNWPADALRAAQLELLARAQLAGVQFAADRGHPRAVASEPVH